MNIVGKTRGRAVHSGRRIATTTGWPDRRPARFCVSWRRNWRNWRDGLNGRQRTGKIEGSESMFRRFVVLIAATLPMAPRRTDVVVEEIAAKVNGDIITRGELDQQRRDLEAEAPRRGAHRRQAAGGGRTSTRPTRCATRSISCCWCRRARTSTSTSIPRSRASWPISRCAAKISDPDKFQRLHPRTDRDELRGLQAIS